MREQCVAEHIGQPKGLDDDTAQFLENRRGFVRLIVLLLADDLHVDQPHPLQPGQLAL